MNGPEPGETWKDYVARQTEAYGPRDLGKGLCVCNRFAGRHFLGCPYYEDEDEARLPANPVADPNEADEATDGS